MSLISSINANLPTQGAVAKRSDASEPAKFTRKPSQIIASANDKSPDAPEEIAEQLSAKFNRPGNYYFPFGGAGERAGRLQQTGNGRICISGPGDRVVTIENGKITDMYDHVRPPVNNGRAAAVGNPRLPSWVPPATNLTPEIYAYLAADVSTFLTAAKNAS